MKPEKLKDLLLESLTSENDEDVRSLIMDEALPDYNFKPGFRSTVMDKISLKGSRAIIRFNQMRSYNFVFIRIALTGIAAIVILAISLLMNQGSLSYDTILGIDNQVDDPLISLLME